MTGYGVRLIVFSLLVVASSHEGLTGKGKKMIFKQTGLSVVSSIVLFFLLAMAGTCRAEGRLTVAVAANFAPALNEISKQFTRTTGIALQTSVSSSGRLYAQISNGAPFDLFFQQTRNDLSDYLEKAGVNGR